MDGLVASDSVTFGRWRYDRQPGRLFQQREDGGWEPAVLGSRAGDILAALLREPGTLVSKDDLMDAAWPGVTVEANNLTVQIAALRRMLDDGVTGPSCVQTVPGRGYRMLCRVDDPAASTLPSKPAAQAEPAEVAAPAAAASFWIRRRRWQIRGGLASAALLGAIGFLLWPGRSPTLPRMSAFVMPFENVGGPDDAKIAAALTDDLKAALSLTTPVQIVNGKAAAQSLDSHTMAVDAIGRQLGARYVITGSERRLDGILRLNAAIVSTETARVLWTDRFDVSLSDSAAGQEAAVARLRSGIYVALIPLEAARSQSERPANPDAFDLALRAQALQLVPPTPTNSTEIRVLFERAQQLDPSSSFYRLLLVDAILNEADQNPHGRKAAYERTASLLAEAQARDPGSWLGSVTRLYWVAWQENRRCPEVVDLAEQFLKRFPNVGANNVIRWLAGCQIVTGHADTAVAVMEHALTLDPSPYRSRDYRNLQFALLLLGRYDESIQAGERALARNPDDVGWERARLSRRLAAAYALSGRIDEARRKFAEANRIDPNFTLRTIIPESGNATYVAQFVRVIEGYRLAGARDHAEEDADFGVAADGRLHQEYAGRTPLTVPGAQTIHTGALAPLLADQHPIVIDTLESFSGPSLPGAVGLRYVGAGGELDDLAQARLRTTMRDLTKGDLGTPIVAVGWNSESFDGPNLALRLVALGYTHVLWYRGGREAWEVRGLQEDNLTPYDW